MSTVELNDTKRIRGTFYTWSDDEDGTLIEDPVSVVYNVYLNSSNTTPIETGSPVKEADGIYYYDWTPDVIGLFVITLVGTFADGSIDVIAGSFTVVISPSPGEPATLLVDRVINFAGVIEPLCVNPDELLAQFPDAKESEIALQIWIASTEVNNWLNLDADQCSTNPLALEYILNAAACALSKTYSDGGGNEQAMTLGDLSVTYQSYAKAHVNRGNATTPCELAAAIRKELLYTITGPRPFVHGSTYDNPIAPRKFRDVTELRVAKRQGLLDGDPGETIYLDTPR